MLVAVNLLCCSNAGAPRHWRHRLDVSWRRVPCSRLSPVMLCLIFQINNFESLGAIII